jgi:hypothetical protein
MSLKKSGHSPNGWLFSSTRNMKYVLSGMKCIYYVVCLNGRVAKCGVDRFIGNGDVARFGGSGGVARFVETSGVASFAGVRGV